MLLLLQALIDMGKNTVKEGTFTEKKLNYLDYKLDQLMWPGNEGAGRQ